MAEQLPDGFGKQDFIWGPDGRKVYQIPKTSDQEKKAFSQSGIDFDVFDARRAEQERQNSYNNDADGTARLALRGMDPEFKKLLEENGVDLD